MKTSGRTVRFLAGACLLLASGATAQQRLHQRHVRREAGSNRVVLAQMMRPAQTLARSNHPAASVADPAALDLLKRVFHHTQDYVGIQRTQAGEKMSEQKIVEDIHGHLRLEYPAPSEFQGDIVLTAPNNFYHYHARQNRTDVAYWPISKQIKDQAVINMVRRGMVTLAITGEEVVVGRDCAILTLSWQRASGQAETQRRLWVDTASGIVVRREQWNATGQISASYMTSIKVGPEAGVTGKDFNPGLLPKTARNEAMFPLDTPPFATVAQAEAQAGFHILEPAQMPENYTLDGVWVFGRNRGASVLLRYTVGVNHYSLFEHPAYNAKPQQLERPYRRSGASIQRWFAPVPNGVPINILYIGHMSPDEVLAIHDSLR